MSEAVTVTGILVKRKPLVATILTSSVANPTVLTTSIPHGLVNGQSVTIAGHVGSTPAISGVLVATVISPTTFSVPVNVTVGGTGGTATTLLFTTVGEITKVTPPKFHRNKSETSTHNEKRESNILGILRQPDPGFTINFLADDATHQAIFDDIIDDVKASWQFSFPSGLEYDGPARVQTFNHHDAPVDGVQAVDVVLTWAGAVVQS